MTKELSEKIAKEVEKKIGFPPLLGEWKRMADIEEDVYVLEGERQEQGVKMGKISDGMKVVVVAEKDKKGAWSVATGMKFLFKGGGSGHATSIIKAFTVK